MSNQWQFLRISCDDLSQLEQTARAMGTKCAAPLGIDTSESVHSRGSILVAVFCASAIFMGLRVMLAKCWVYYVRL